MAALAAGAGASSTAPNLRPLGTAVFDPISFAGGEAQAAFVNVRRAGARYVRLTLDWSSVAPAGSQAPPGFSPRDPADPLYRWDGFDGQVTAAVEAGLTPIVDIVNAPRWAQSANPSENREDGPYLPKPTLLADFATAAARRYGGDVEELPRVTYWQVWNEPNLSYHLNPQEVDGRSFSPGWYRSMVNSMAKAVHRVHADNVVVAGGLGPYGNRVGTLLSISPLAFMRQLFCLSGGPKPRPTCGYRVELDVWSHHPYTNGGPTRNAARPDDVAIGDLGEMNALLRAAERAGHVRSKRPLRFWVTEFSWDTAPPDPKGVPMKLHVRWTAEALYRMWSDGVELVTWFLVRDTPFPKTSTQSGLYFASPGGIASDPAKPMLRAFRFPFVAFRQEGGGIVYWGRTPDSAARIVVVERASPDGWRHVAVVRANRAGIFTGRVAASWRKGSLRARIPNGEVSPAFGLRVPRDLEVCPFGTC